MALGMTQVQLSEAVAVTPQAVSLWEKGKRFPDAPAQLMLFKVLGLNPVELLTGLEMFDEDLKNGIRSHLSRIDEKVFVAGMVHDEDSNESYLDLSDYRVLTAGEHGEGQWVPYTEYHNVEATEKPKDPYALPASPYDPEKLYLNHGHCIFVIPVEILEAMYRPQSFTVFWNHEEGVLALQFSDDADTDGFDIPEKLYGGSWKGLHVLGGGFGRELCKEMGVRSGLDLIEIEPEVLLEQRAVILPLDKAKRVNVHIGYSNYLLPQWQYEELAED